MTVSVVCYLVVRLYWHVCFTSYKLLTYLLITAQARRQVRSTIANKLLTRVSAITFTLFDCEIKHRGRLAVDRIRIPPHRNVYRRSPVLVEMCVCVCVCVCTRNVGTVFRERVNAALRAQR